jgi:hypothetical protein
MMNPCKKLAGSRYKYIYETETETKVKGTSTDTIGISLTATVWLTISDSREFAEIKVEAAEITPKSPSALYSAKPFPELFRHPLTFKITNGRVIEIYPTAGETEEILNIKRGIVSAFQVTLASSDGKQTVNETDVLGTCETTVRQHRVSANEVIILKNRDTGSCSKCGVFTIPRQSEHQEARFVGGWMNAQYIVSGDDIIQVASLSQVEELMPLSAEAGKIQTVLRQKLTVIGSPVGNISLTICPIHVSTLNFSCDTCVLQNEQGSLLDSEDLIELIADSPPHDILHHFANLIESMKKCSKLELDELKELYVQSNLMNTMSHQHTEEGNEMQKTMKKHMFFLDALAFVGTEQALDLIVEFVTEDPVTSLLSSTRQNELILSLAFLPVHATCPCLILKHILIIVRQKPLYTIAKLVLGAVINKAWLLPTDSCPALITEAMDFLIYSLKMSLDKLPHNFDLQANAKLHGNEFHQSLQQHYDNVIYAIKALGNAGLPQSLETLKSAINDKRLQNEGRAVAVYALRSISRRVPDEVQSITLDIFYNKREEQEVRIAAFLTFMSSIASPLPKAKILTLMKAVQNEPNLYVKSFVCTYLMAVERSEDPSIFTLRYVVSYHMKISGLSLVCPAMDKGYFSSKATRSYVSLADAGLPRSLPRDVMGIGLSTGVLLDQSSWLPHSASGKVTANLFGYDMELFEVGVRGTGIEQLFGYLFGPIDILNGGPRSLNPSGLRQSEVKINKLDNIHASAYLKVLGQEIYWRQWGEDTIMRKLQDHQIWKYLSKTIYFDQIYSFRISDVVHNLVHFFNCVWKGVVLIHHGRVNITKTVRLLDVKRIIPTIAGMPLNLIAKVAGHVQLNGEGEIKYSTRSVFNKVMDYFSPPKRPHQDEIHAWVELSPKLSVMSFMDVSLGAYHFEPKLVLVANATSNFTQQINASLYENHTLSVKLLEVPESETCLLNASYTQFLEINGSRFTLGIYKYNKTMLYDPVGSDLLNMTLFSNISYPNGTGINQAPLFPLSGPAHLTLTLVKKANNLEMIEFRLYNTSENFLDNGLIRFELNPVGYQFGPGLSGRVTWCKEDGNSEIEIHLDCDCEKSLANISGLFYVTTHNRLDIEGSVSFTTAVSNISAIFRFNRDHFCGSVHYEHHSLESMKPIIKIPDFCLKVCGSLVDNTDGKMSVGLGTECSCTECSCTECSDAPHWLKVNYTTHGLMVDVSATASLFHNVNMFYILPYPLKSSEVCYVFDGHATHVITFDGQKQEYQLDPGCEYVLAQHNRDAFALTRKDKEIMIYVNGTKYTLTPDHTMLKVNDIDITLPYKRKHLIHVRSITGNGHQYIHFTAWFGLDVYYSGGNVQLDINGFYMNQLQIAGLCGTANHKSEDDTMLPGMSLAETEKDTTSGWKVSCDQVPTPKHEMKSLSCNRTVMNHSCNFFFSDIVQDARGLVDVMGFYRSCLSDVSFCQSPLSSIHAYLRAAQAKHIGIAACVYGNWSKWSTCDKTDNLQYRERPILNNLFPEICERKSENRSCEKLLDEQCMIKSHAFLILGLKFCRSVHRIPKCAQGCNGTYTRRILEFQCIHNDVPKWNLYLNNIRPVSLHYDRYLVSCIANHD